MTRPRRDPRHERLTQVVAQAPRQRLDRARRNATPAFASLSQPVTEPVARIVTVEDPEFWVAAVADPGTDRLSALDRQLLGAARALAGQAGGVILVIDRMVHEVGAAGADRLVQLPQISDPNARMEAVLALLTQFRPRHVVLPETLDGGDLARRIAAATGQPLFNNAEQLSARGIIRTAKAGQIDQVLDQPPPLLTIAPDMIAPYQLDRREARPLAFTPPVAASAATSEIMRPQASALPLSEADFVASAGNGIDDLALFRAVAEALGATPGASRVLCDAGLMPREAQVGASGTVLAANCYLALGISGAPQHLQGIAGCEHVLAINTDLHAAMIERAELAIVADAHPVMQALLRLLREGDAP